jgi:hypothetical protein
MDSSDTPTAAAQKIRKLVESAAEKGEGPASDRDSKKIIPTLERNSWWWRHMEEPFEGDSFVLSRHGKVLRDEFGLDVEIIENLKLMMLTCQEYPAFIYEMSVRIIRPALIPVPWVNLDSSIKLPLIDAFERPRVFRPVVASVEPAGERHWTDVCPWCFSMAVTDSEIIGAFSNFIRSQRHVKGIPNPKPNVGKRNRGFSWRPIEILDQKRFGALLNDSDRSHLSKAKREVQAALDIRVRRGE